MNIRTALPDDYTIVAQLHRNSITTGFLSKLGHEFLKNLYRAIGKQQGAKIFVAESRGHVCGFVAGTVNTNGLYKRVILKNWPRFILLLLKFLLSGKMLKMLCETFFYGFKKEVNTKNIIKAELLSISVEQNSQGKGVGKKLVSELERYFRNSGITIYKVVAFSEDRKVNKFYQSCEFILGRQFVHHKNLMNEYKKII